MIVPNDALVENILSIARAAGQVIMASYHRSDVITLKEDRSPLTVADRASHDLIVGKLRALTPNVPIVSEEAVAAAFAERSGWAQCWMIDPLDGTKEFVNRNGEFTVNIALIERGASVLGVVYAPALDVAYFAHANGPARRADVEGTRHVRASDHRVEGLRVVASRSHAGVGMPVLLERLGSPPCVSKGSSLKFCLVADGTANLYPRLGPTMEWDVAAAHCVVTAAGGSITDLKGTTLTYNKPDLRNPHLITCGSPAYPWQAAFEDLPAD